MNYTTDDGTATLAAATLADSDYTDNDGTITINGADTTGTITIVTGSDGDMEFDEILTVNLTGATQTAGTLSDGVGLGTIENDDDNGYIWIGDVDNDFDNGANWSNNTTAPGSGDAIVFTDACQGEVTCDPVTSSNVDVQGVWMYGSYTGNWTQSAGHTITVGSDSWIQAGGTFTGGDSLIDINRNYEQLGGTFNSTTGNLEIGYNIYETAACVANDRGFTKSGGTFSHNNGTTHFNWAGNNSCWNIRGARINITDGNLDLYNLALNASSNYRSALVFQNSSRIIANGNLSLTGGYYYQGTGFLETKGDLTGINSQILKGDTIEVQGLGIQGKAIRYVIETVHLSYHILVKIMEKF